VRLSAQVPRKIQAEYLEEEKQADEEQGVKWSDLLTGSTYVPVGDLNTESRTTSVIPHPFPPSVMKEGARATMEREA